MTSVAPGSSSLLFHRSEDVVDHLLKNVLANQKRRIGTEWEMFFVKPEFFTTPDFFRCPGAYSFTREDGQKAFAEFKRVYELMGYKPDFITEPGVSGSKVIGLKIPDHGSIVPEAGYQFEFSTTVCTNDEEVLEKNQEAMRAITEVAKRLKLTVVFRGQVPGFAEKSQGMDRSRSEQWHQYYDSDRFDPRAMSILREAQDGTASVQVTLDSGASKFHEYFKALLLIEPALTLYYTNSNRSYVGMRAYGTVIPSQVEPIVSVWTTQNAREALTAIVDRLMDIDVPFLPDPENPGLYKAEPLQGDRPPTTRHIMEQGRLSEQMLNNIGGFFYTRPAFKNFAQALLEVRGVDSQPTPEAVTEVAKRVAALVYDDSIRKQLLDDYAYLTTLDIQKLHQASTMSGKEEAFRIDIADFKVGDFVNDIIARSHIESQVDDQVDTHRALLTKVSVG